MRILRAETMGMCFGVRDALDVAFARRDADEITIHGELVHNREVADRLGGQGYRQIPEHARAGVPHTTKVLITAHGVSDRERRRLRRRGKELIDTTCPLVRRAHEAAVRLSDEGWHVVVVGKPGHVEVEGLVGDLKTWDVAPDVGSVARYPYPRIGVVCQTTCTEARAAEVLEEVLACNPDAEVRFVDTICEPTRQRVRAIEALCDVADRVVVVGGANSNNTKQLARMVEARGVPANHVQGPDDIDPMWFAGCSVVGLTAGTSTLAETVDAVHAALECFAARGPSGLAAS